jgi:hypothetical protein
VIALTLLLAIHFTTMADFYHKDKQTIIFNGIDNAVISHPKTVEVIGAAELFGSMRPRCCGKGIDF